MEEGTKANTGTGYVNSKRENTKTNQTRHYPLGYIILLLLYWPCLKYLQCLKMGSTGKALMDSKKVALGLCW